MNDHRKTKNQLIRELEELRTRIKESVPEHKQTEAQFRKLSQAVEQNPCSIIITALQGTIEYVNPKFSRISGYSPEEALGKTPALVRSGYHDSKFYQELWKTISTGREWRGEMCNRNKRGELYWVSSSISPVTDSNGVITHYVAVNEDITERKKTEKALRESEERYRSLVENINLGIVLMDTDNNIVMVNTALSKMLKRDISELVGGKCYKEFENYKSICKDCPGKRAMETRLPQEVELEAVLKDGSVISLWIRDFPVFDHDGAATGFIEIVEDITDRKRTEREKKKIENDKKMLEIQFQRTQRMESISRLAGGIAHNFNNILSGVLGYASLIKSQIDHSHQFYDDITFIEQSANRASLLVKRLLEFAQAKGLKMEPVKLSQIMESSYSLLKGALDKDIVLEHIDKSENWSFMGDKNQIQQATMNLCLNASDAMPAGGKLTVLLKTIKVDQPHPIRGDELAPGKYVVLEVSDTGKGMTEETMEHIFEPFFSTKEMWEGTGLGLATVYGMVKDHRGYIDVQSQPGAGSVFTFYFPAIEPAE